MALQDAFSVCLRSNAVGRRLGLLLLLVIMTACQEAKGIPTLLPSAASTMTLTTPSPHETMMPASTNTPIPLQMQTTATILPPALSEHGPYLAYKKDNAIVLINADGSGRKEIKLPEGGYVRNLRTAISPDGKWLAYHLGPANWYSASGYPSELSLNLIDIPNGNLSLVTRLFSDNASDRSYSHGILAMDWSEYSHYLAFAGAMDGASTELYVYDTQTGTIHRLTNDILDIWNIDWSPDMKSIWFENVTLGDNQNLSFNVMDFDPNTIKEPTLVYSGSMWTVGAGWLSNESYFLYDIPDGGCGPSNFRYVDIQAGQTKILWADSASAFTLDRDNQRLVVSTDCGEMGSYFVNWDGTETKISEDILYEISFPGGKSAQYLGFDGMKVWAIHNDGTTTEMVSKPFGAASVSPDHRWYLLYQEPNLVYAEITGMDLYSEANQYLRTIVEKEAYPVAWRPDSMGVFYISEGLYYVAVPDGEPALIDDCEPDGCGDSFIWLP